LRIAEIFMNKFILSFKKIWPLYLFGLAGSIAISCFAVEQIIKPRNEETFLFFTASYSYECDNLKYVLKENMPSYLREIKCNSYYLKDNNFDNYFSTVGLISSDIMIVPQSIMTEELAKSYCTKLDRNYVTSLLGEVTFLNYGDSIDTYGVRIHEKGKHEDSEHLITYTLNEEMDEDYYAFYRNGSLHLGELSSTKWTTAFDYTKVLLNYVWEK